MRVNPETSGRVSSGKRKPKPFEKMQSLSTVIKKELTVLLSMW